MEHILQFAIDIDDETIKRLVMEKAEKQIIAELTKDFRSMIFQRSHYNSDALSKDVKHEVIQSVMNAVIEECKDDIIKQAVDQLTDRLSRTKRAKELLAEIEIK
jgi:Ni,Fe-hydrogenase III component G